MSKEIWQRIKLSAQETSIYFNPRKLFQVYKGIGSYRVSFFEHYFHDEGITGGFRYPTYRGEMKTNYWYSSSLDSALYGDGYEAHAGSFPIPRYGLLNEKFCLAVMQKGSRRKRPLLGDEALDPYGAARGRQIIYWKNVHAIFMNRNSFEQIKDIYTQTMNGATHTGISWEDFCKKITLVESRDQFTEKFSKYQLLGRRLGRVSSGLTSEDMLINSLRE